MAKRLLYNFVLTRCQFATAADKSTQTLESSQQFDKFNLINIFFKAGFQTTLIYPQLEFKDLR